MINNNFKSSSTKYIWPLIFVWFAIFRYFLILGGDDFFWWGSKGKYLLDHGFVGDVKNFGGSGNGRYIGSILAIYTMKSKIIGILVYGIVGTLLIYFMWKVSKKTWIALLISLFGILLMPLCLFSDILSWNSAFVNYVPPIITSLFFIHTVLQKNQYDKITAVLTFIVMFFGEFFLESMTIYQLLLTFGTLLFYYHKNKDIRLAIYGLLASILGSIIMFLNGSYYLNNTNGYRSAAGGISEVINNYVFQTHFYFLSFNFILNISLILVLLSLILLKTSNKRKICCAITISILYLAYFVCFNVYVSVKGLNTIFEINNLSLTVAWIDTFIMTSFWALIVLMVFCLLKTHTTALFFLISGGITAGPMFLLSDPLRIRGFFGSYIFLLLLLINFNNVLINLVKNKFKFGKLKKIFIINALLLVLGCAINTEVIMIVNYKANIQRTSNKIWLEQVPFKTLTNNVPFVKYVKGNDNLNYQSREYYVYREKMNFWERLFN